MSFFSWSESMSVGIPLLDDDHEIIIRLNIRLQDGLERQEDAPALVEICERLIAFTEFHLAREEKVMEACAYPDLEKHREDHMCFIHGVYGFMDRYAADPGRAVLRELLSYLREWFEHHVLIEDTRMRAYIADHQRAHEVAEAFGRLDPL